MSDDHAGARPAAWRESWTTGDSSPFVGRDQPHSPGEFRTLTYEVDDRVARITFNRPEQGNAITADTPIELTTAVEQADLDPGVPTVSKLHGFCVAGGTDIALFCDQIVCADDTKIGYPPTRVWGIPAAGMWAHRLGDQRAKRLLLTGDCLTGKQAVEWGLAVESAPLDQLDDITERLVQRIARMPVNQLMMVKLALNSALLAQGVQNSTMISTVFDGIARHTREGYAFQLRAATAGYRQAVRERDEPFGDHKRGTDLPVRPVE